MPASITLAPLRPGRLDEWREFYAQLRGPRRAEWAHSQRRRGVTREAVWLLRGDPGPRAVVLVESDDPETARAVLAVSEDPFDVWYRECLGDLLEDSETAVPVFDSRPRPGTWRGLQRRGIR